MNISSYFNKPRSTQQCHYEALRAFYIDDESLTQVASRFGFTCAYFKKLCTLFKQQLKTGRDPIFIEKKRGPKKRRTDQTVIEKIIALRKHNYSITDIKANLHSDNQVLSVDAIDQILKGEGFAPLPKRTHEERLKTQIPESLQAPKSNALIIKNEIFTTEMNAGPLYSRA